MKKKGFTLIELLAVIVILAIIAVIATPIILGIVENTRKEAFQRSVELVEKATSLNVNNKTYETNYTYTLTDGVISDDVAINNTEGMNGSIIYDKEGNVQYAIHNDKWCVIKNNETTITDYVDGECELEGSSSNSTGGILATITNLVPNENDVVTSGNGQLINLGEYGIRYQGTDPNNYVEFSGETWRIIGIVDGKVKLIKATELANPMPWNNQDGDGTYDSGIDINDWSNATLQTYLNGDYYNSLTDNSMIDTSTWYLRGHNTTQGIDKYEMYGIERETGTVMYETPSIEGNIGIMYPSDYGFAAQETDTCTNEKELYSYEPCKDTNWIAYTQTNAYEWLITPHSGYESNAFNATSSGYVRTDIRVNRNSGVRPVLYLKSNVKITGDGDGSSNNKYQLTME